MMIPPGSTIEAGSLTRLRLDIQHPGPAEHPPG